MGWPKRWAIGSAMIIGATSNRVRRDICQDANAGDLAYDLVRKRNINDLHGLGAFLIMNEQLRKETRPGLR